MIKVDIISGFLGAGKTTFIKALIEKVFRGEKIVLIENEFGEIGIDSRFMQNCGIEVTEMNSGCICCTLVGDFAEALKKVAAEFEPDRIIIEPSGVGKLSDVAAAVAEIQESAGMELDGKITVVDGKKVKMYMKNFGEFYNDQIEHAGTIVVSRTQMMDEDRLSECLHLIREKNEHAAVITTPWDQLSGEIIQSALDAHDHDHHEDHHHGHEHHHHNHHDHHHEHHHEHAHHDHHHHHDHDHDHHDHHDHHHADEIFSSWGIETVHRFDRNELADALKLMGMSDSFGTVLRAKGIVEGADGQWMEFDMVPEETEIRDCEPDYTGRICVIGTDLNTADLEKVFGK